MTKTTTLRCRYSQPEGINTGEVMGCLLSLFYVCLLFVFIEGRRLRLVV